MAEQRRYKPPGYTEEQFNRVLSSGERPPTEEEMPTASRAMRNMAIGIPRAVTDLSAMFSLVVPGVKAGYNTLAGSEEQQEQGFGANFGEALYGKQGIVELNDFMESEVGNRFSQLPAHLQNNKNKDRIIAALEGSKQYKELTLKYADNAYAKAIRAQDAVNEMAGLGGVETETVGDEVFQAVGGALLPIGSVAKIGTNIANQGAKALLKKGARSALELSLVGSKMTVPSIAANVAVQTVQGQIFRGLTDQPSVFTGDEMLAEEMATSGEVTNDAGALVKTPSGKTVTPPAPTPDEQQGMGGQKKAAIAAGAGAAFIAIGALRARGARNMTKAILDDTVPDTNLPVPNSTETPKAMLRPSLSGAQRRYSDFVNRNKPIKDVAEKAMIGMSEAHIQKQMEIIERLAHEAAPVNIFAAAARTIRYGDLPGLGRKTVPVEELEKFLSTMAPPERQSWMQTMQLKHTEGEWRKQTNSLQDEIDIEKNKIRNGTGSVQQLKILQAQQQKAQGTNPFANMSVQDARTQMATFDANMRNRAGERMYRQIAKDIREASVKRGHYTQQEMDKMVLSNPYYVPQINDPYANATWWRKGGSIIKDELTGRSESKLYEKRAAVFSKGGVHERVDTPADPITSLKKSVHDFHSYDRKNEAIARFVDAVSNTPDWGKAMRKAHDPVTMSEFNNGKVPKSILENNKVVAFSRHGRIHFVELADKELARSLQFNPGASMHVLDAARRFEQARLTGVWAPWFAWKGAKYEITPTRMLKRHNRQFGIIQNTIKRAFPNAKIVDIVNDYMADGSVKMQMISHAYGDITNNAIEAMARKISYDLTYQSGFFNKIAQLPGGRDALYRVGDIMTRSFNDTIYTFLHKQGVLGQTFSDEPTIAMLKGYDSAELLLKGNAQISGLMKAYRSVIDSVRSSAKTTFFVQNFKRLEREYKAKGQKVPQSEVDKLVYEAKVSSGDMTISPGNKLASQAITASNYLKTNINSLAALGEAAVKRPTDFGLRFLTTAVVPKIWTVSKISGVGALANWYWNDLSDQERRENTPMIKPEFFLEWQETGKKPALRPDHFTLTPDAPETRAFTDPIIAAFQYFGAFGSKNIKGVEVNAQQHMNSWPEVSEMLGDAMDSLISIPLPGAVNALFGVKGELQRVVSGMFNEEPIIEVEIDDPELGDSQAERYAVNAFMAMFGTVADIAKNASGNVEPDDNLIQAVGKIFYHTARETVVSKIPEQFEEFGSGTLFGGQRRLRATTGTRERMIEVFDKVEGVVKQRSLERRGLTDQVLADPMLVRMRDDLINGLNRHGVQRLKKRRGEVNNLLKKLNKERYKMSPGNFLTTQNALQNDMQHINEKQQAALDSLDNRFMIRYKMTTEDALNLLSEQQVQ